MRALGSSSISISSSLCGGNSLGSSNTLLKSLYNPSPALSTSCADGIVDLVDDYSDIIPSISHEWHVFSSFSLNSNSPVVRSWCVTMMDSRNGMPSMMALVMSNT